MSESECESPIKKRRGSGNTTKVMKEARLRGEEFVTTKGKLVEKKSTGPDCKCKKMCTTMFDGDQKSGIISTVYSGRPKNESDTYLMGLIECHNVSRHRPTTSESKQFAFSFKYYAYKNNERIEVCRNAFLSLHAISSKAVFRLTSLLAKGAQPVDMRGRHDKHHKILQDVLVKVDSHIESFPQKISHYSTNPVTYLEAGLNCKILHNLLIIKHPELKEVITYKYFLQHYQENYGYRFGRPQVDVCSTCEDLNSKIKSSSLNDNAKRAAVAELIVHKRRACKFYKKIKSVTDMCTNRDDVAGVVFDFMQNLPLPCLPVQEMFYLRKLWQFVFCVHSLGDNKAVFYTYHEGEAKKGPDEVCTFLNDYIVNNISPQVKELNVFSDACPGQNRNHTFIRFLMGLSIFGRFKNINVYFPVRGHSFLPCDRDFGTIKRVIRHHDRIYSPEQYCDLILSAKKKQPLFQVKHLRNEEITDYKNWWPTFFKKTAKSLGTPKESFKISKYKHFLFKEEEKAMCMHVSLLMASTVMCSNFLKGET